MTAKPVNTVPKNSIQVIARAAKVLRSLEGEEDGLSLSQIARLVGLARSTVRRIVVALREEQFVMAASPTSRVRLGPALTRLARSASALYPARSRTRCGAGAGTGARGGPRPLGPTIWRGWYLPDVSIVASQFAVFIGRLGVRCPCNHGYLPHRR